jgi:hypothetical protein
MGKRLVIKTAMICAGVFVMMSAALVFFIFRGREFDDEKRYKVLIAADSIEKGTVLTDGMLSYRTVKESALNEYMVTDILEAVGKKCLSGISEGDYLREYELLPESGWYKDEDKVVILPMDIESRLANLIRKGSLIDIKIDLDGVEAPPKVVLAKVPVMDILDENGTSSNGILSGKRAFAIIVLDNEQRDRLYIARDLGRLVYELYCDPTQKPAEEEFSIPPEYVAGTGAYFSGIRKAAVNNSNEVVMKDGEEAAVKEGEE